MCPGMLVTVRAVVKSGTCQRVPQVLLHAVFLSHFRRIRVVLACTEV